MYTNAYGTKNAKRNTFVLNYRQSSEEKFTENWITKFLKNSFYFKEYFSHLVT